MNATRILLAPSAALTATWALIGSAAIASFIGPLAFIAAVFTWPFLIPITSICSLIGCYTAVKEPQTKQKLGFVGLHLLSLVLAIGTGFVAYTYGKIGLVPTAG